MKKMHFTSFLLLFTFLLQNCSRSNNLHPSPKTTPKDSTVAKTSDDSSPPSVISDVNTMQFEIVLDKTSQKNELQAAKIKYNKSGWITGEWDDNSIGAITGFNVLKNYSYTDGCGNNIPYRMSVAVNGRNSYNNVEYGTSDLQIVNYDLMKMLIQNGWDVENHGYYHSPDGNYNFGTDWSKDISELDDMLFNRIGYRMNGSVVPTNYDGFATASKSFGYLFSSSQGTFDNMPPGATPDWSSKTENFDRAPKYFSAFGRMFYDDWSQMQSDFTQHTNNIIGTTNTFFRIASHTIDEKIFTSMMSYFRDKTNDKFIVVPTREIMEYRVMLDQPVKTAVNGNKITVTVDISKVPARFRWRDMSFVLSSDAKISTVTIDNNIDKVTFNPQTGLINIFNQKSKWN